MTDLHARLQRLPSKSQELLALGVVSRAAFPAVVPAGAGLGKNGPLRPEADGAALSVAP